MFPRQPAGGDLPDDGASPSPTSDGLEAEGGQDCWEDKYLHLFDQFGVDSPQVRDFEKEHRLDAGAEELFATVRGLEQKGVAARRRRRLAGALWATAVAMIAFIAAAGVGRSMEFDDQKKSLQTAQQSVQEQHGTITTLRGQNAQLDEKIKKQKDELGETWENYVWVLDNMEILENQHRDIKNQNRRL